MRIVPALMAACLSACSTPATQTPASSSLPERVQILDAALTASLLKQCSRDAPKPGEGSWTPDMQSIVALERLLPEALRKQQRDHDWSEFPRQWTRQYVGIVRNGRRYLYGNYLPDPVTSDDMPPGTVLMVCDGGPSYFGAEYDVAAKKISHLAFNGVA